MDVIYVSSSDSDEDVDRGTILPNERFIYETVLEDLSQPKSELDLHDGLMSVPLLRHQKIALAWMEHKERTGHPCAGGILADDQGLGKTVSMIALILKQMPLQKMFLSSQSEETSHTSNLLDHEKNPSNIPISQAVKNYYFEDPLQLAAASTSTASSKGKLHGGTLVVCPSSILCQWSQELLEKVGRTSNLSVLIYHGNSRIKHPSELGKYDVVITTYNIITNEVPKLGKEDGDYGFAAPNFSNGKKRKANSNVDNKKEKKKGNQADLEVGPLSKVKWFRIILDEAQIIKNSKTQVSKACCSLKAKTRWCLSGTPLQNAVDDLYSYFRFLKYDPYADHSYFHSALKYPLVRDPTTGYNKLQPVLRAVMLRRTKGTTLDGQPILKLPPKSVSLKKLHFSVEERSFYSHLEAHFRDRFKSYASEGTVKQNYANILTMLLRLRQACDHPLLVKNDDEHDSSIVSQSDFKQSTIFSEIYQSKKIKATLKILTQIQSRNSIGEDICADLASTSGTISDGNTIKESESKLPEKAIVFSQWTGMLDLLEGFLNFYTIQYRRLDGSMSLASRDKAVKQFNTDPEVTVMIMSLKAGNVGLNMVAACHVILLDLWWNPTCEDQAIDRAHRIGQTRPVSVHRLTIEDTVEERILQLQEKKREMISCVFGEDPSGKKTATRRLTTEDLRYLFQV